MTEYPPPGEQPSNYPQGQYPQGYQQGGYQQGGYQQGGGYPPPPGQYPPPPPGNYPPPGQPYWQQSQSRGLAITALVLGVLALLSFWTLVGGILFGLFAAIFGIIATVKSRRGTAAGGGMAIAGLILGLLGLIGSIVLLAVGVNIFVKNGGKDYIDCVNSANGDQTKIQQCAQDFSDTLESKYSVTFSPEPTS